MNKFIEFGKKIASDATLAAEVEKTMKDNNVMDGIKLADLSDEAVNAVILVAKKAGFEFTLAEFKVLVSGGALSDEELGAVAGGGATYSRSAGGQWEIFYDTPPTIEYPAVPPLPKWFYDKE